MGGYITMDKDLEEDPRTDDLGHALYEVMGGLYRDDCDASQRRPADERLFGVCRDAVIGGLYKLWRYGDAFIGRHNRLKGASRGAARIAEITSLPASLVQQFPSEWLRIHPDGTVELPEYSEKNRMHDRDIRRSSGRERTARWRERKAAEKKARDASHSVTHDSAKRHRDAPTGTVPVPTQTGPDHPDRTGAGPAAKKPGSRAPKGASPGGKSESERHANGHTKTDRELEADARKLAAAGMGSADIAKTLAQYGVEQHQVIAWISNEPAAAT